MAVTKPTWEEENKTDADRANQEEGIFDTPILEEESLGVQELYKKLNESLDLTNTHTTQMATNNAKIGMTLAKGLDNVTFSFSKGTLTIRALVGRDSYSINLKMAKD